MASYKQRSAKDGSQPAREETAVPFNQLLAGVSFVISGLVNPERAELRSKAVSMGARYLPDWCPQATLLATAFPNTPKCRAVTADGGTIVTCAWIHECYKKKKLVPPAAFLVNDGTRPWRQAIAATTTRDGGHAKSRHESEVAEGHAPDVLKDERVAPDDVEDGAHNRSPDRADRPAKRGGMAASNQASAGAPASKGASASSGKAPEDASTSGQRVRKCSAADMEAWDAPAHGASAQQHKHKASAGQQESAGRQGGRGGQSVQGKPEEQLGKVEGERGEKGERGERGEKGEYGEENREGKGEENGGQQRDVGRSRTGLRKEVLDRHRARMMPESDGARAESSGASATRVPGEGHGGGGDVLAVPPVDDAQVLDWVRRDVDATAAYLQGFDAAELERAGMDVDDLARAGILECFQSTLDDLKLGEQSLVDILKEWRCTLPLGLVHIRDAWERSQAGTGRNKKQSKAQPLSRKEQHDLFQQIQDMKRRYQDALASETAQKVTNERKTMQFDAIATVLLNKTFLCDQMNSIDHTRGASRKNVDLAQAPPARMPEATAPGTWLNESPFSQDRIPPRAPTTPPRRKAIAKFAGQQQFPKKKPQAADRDTGRHSRTGPTKRQLSTCHGIRPTKDPKLGKRCGPELTERGTTPGRLTTGSLTTGQVASATSAFGILLRSTHSCGCRRNDNEQRKRPTKPARAAFSRKTSLIPS
eukprot:jgi/Mesvir1/8649/Mv02593-RA.1